MKFNCDKARLRKEKWHKFYAIWPIRFGVEDCRSFEYIERKGTFHHIDGWSWEYRLIE